MVRHIINYCMVILILILMLSPFSPALAQTCEECRGLYIETTQEGEVLKSEFCPKSEPAGDGCNTCMGNYYCRRDKEGNAHWYGDRFSLCTSVYCGDIEIETGNPFKE